MTTGLDESNREDVSAALAVAALDLARRFAAGGRLWCWSPGAPEHAQHVAVEFVHPVVVGARALPAVALLGDDAAATLRLCARPGDVLLLVVAGDADIHGVLRRAEAWGVSTVCLGAGPGARGAIADHELWMSDAAAARHDGRLVLGYHLLWELTQVCFEHPGLLDPLATADCDTTGCTTCSDDGHLGEVVRVDDDEALVRTAAGIETVNTMLVGDVHADDLVLVHAGTAIAVVDP